MTESIFARALALCVCVGHKPRASSRRGPSLPFALAGLLALAACRDPSVAEVDSASVVPHDATTQLDAGPSRAPAEGIDYPEAPRSEHVDTYHGVRVADPYRWLENIDSEASSAWVDRQIAVTRSHLDAIDGADRISRRLKQVWNYERYGMPSKKGGRYFISRNTGLQDQSVLYWRADLKSELRELLDPNTLSEDGTRAISGVSVSRDGKFLAYGISDSGSDWQTWFVRDIDSGRDLEDRVEWVKFSQAVWHPDGSGFFYARYDAPESGKLLSEANFYHKLYFHRIGTPQSADELVYERKDQPQWTFHPTITEDGRRIVLEVSKGTDRRNLIFHASLTAKSRKFVELIPEFQASFEFIGKHGDELLFHTDLDAPRGRIVSTPVAKGVGARWRELVPQSDATLKSASWVGDRLFAHYLRDAHSQVRIYGLDGSEKGAVALPGLGTASGFAGRAEDRETFYAFKSFGRPATIYRYDLDTGTSETLSEPELAFDPNDFVTEQVFYTSKDGTRVPMFVVRHVDTQLGPDTPAYLYAYGGFNISLTPSFSPANLVWLEMGGIYAQPSLRGGGEYGEVWHAAGTKTRKQNVFDDFIAAAQWLIDRGYTSRDKLAIGGRSNGGLLVGAVLAQRPDLFAAALPGVGVMDMLRFESFTIGAAWASDYGSVQDPDEFRALHAYSPVHNLARQTAYPATLVYTADHDDRVYPAHSYKFAAALQWAQSGPAPTLIRIERKAGHGAGMPVSKRVAQWTDLWAFLVEHLDMTLPKGLK